MGWETEGPLYKHPIYRGYTFWLRWHPHTLKEGIRKNLGPNPNARQCEPSSSPSLPIPIPPERRTWSTVAAAAAAPGGDGAGWWPSAGPSGRRWPKHLHSWFYHSLEKTQEFITRLCSQRLFPPITRHMANLDDTT